MSTFNAGAIEANLTLGRSAWTRDLKKTHKEIKDLENSSISIGVDLDSDNFRVGYDNIERLIEDLDDKNFAPTVDLVTREAEEALLALEERLDRLDSRRVSVVLDADYTQAEAGFMMVSAMADALDGDDVRVIIDADYAKAEEGFVMVTAMADALDGDTVNVNVDADTLAAQAELLILEAQVDSLDGREIDIQVDMDRDMLHDLVGEGGGGSGGGGYLGLWRVLLMAIIGLAPVLSVAVGAMGAAIVGFTAALVGAAGPLLILAGGLALLVQSYNDAAEAGDAMVGPMGDFADALQAVKDAVAAVKPLISDSGFELMAAALNLVADIIPTLVPLFNDTADAITGVLGGVQDFVDSPEYQEMLDFFGGFGIDMLVTFLRIGGNLILFFGRLFDAISPFATDMMGGLEDMTASWAEWADGLENNPAFQHWLENAEKYGPMVLDMLGSLWAALMNISHALEPFAGPMLVGLTSFFDLIANADPNTLTLIAGGFSAIWASTHVLLPVMQGLMGIFEVLPAILGAVSLPALLIAGAIALIAYAVYDLWTKNEDFRQGIIDTWTQIQEVVAPIVEAIATLIRDNWGSIVAWATDLWSQFESIISDAFVIIEQVIRAALLMIQFIWANWGQGLIQILRGVGQILGAVITGIMGIIRGIFQVVSGLLTGDWRKAWDGIRTIASSIGNMVVGIVRGFANVLGGIWSGIRTTIQNVWGAIWPFLRNQFSSFSGWIHTQWDNLIGWFGGLPGRMGRALAGMFAGLATDFRNVINGIIDMWNGLSWTIDIPDKVPGLPNSMEISTPNIGHLATGGYVTEPGIFEVGEGNDPEVVAPEPVLERIVRENSGDSIDYGRLASAIAAALNPILTVLGGGVTAEQLEELIRAASVNINVDARSEGTTAERLARALGFELRVLGYGGVQS